MVTWEPRTGKTFETLVGVRVRLICAQRLVQLFFCDTENRFVTYSTPTLFPAYLSTSLALSPDGQGIRHQVTFLPPRFLVSLKHPLGWDSVPQRGDYVQRLSLRYLTA